MSSQIPTPEEHLAYVKDQLDRCQKSFASALTDIQRLTQERNEARAKCAELEAKNLELRNYGQHIEDHYERTLTASEAQVVELREVLTAYRSAFADGPENCGYTRYEQVDQQAKEALMRSALPPAAASRKEGA